MQCQKWVCGPPSKEDEPDAARARVVSGREGDGDGEDNAHGEAATDDEGKQSTWLTDDETEIDIFEGYEAMLSIDELHNLTESSDKGGLFNQAIIP